jgi:hypothetical protein
MDVDSVLEFLQRLVVDDVSSVSGENAFILRVGSVYLETSETLLTTIQCNKKFWEDLITCFPLIRQ